MTTVQPLRISRSSSPPTPTDLCVPGLWCWVVVNRPNAKRPGARIAAAPPPQRLVGTAPSGGLELPNAGVDGRLGAGGDGYRVPGLLRH